MPDRAARAGGGDALTRARTSSSRVGRPIAGAPGARLSVTLVDAPYDPKALAQMPELRRVARRAGGEGALVGGPTAQEYDLRQSAARDNRVIIPLTLVVVFVILARAAARAARAAAAHPRR